MTEPNHNFELLLSRIDTLVQKQTELTVRLDKMAEGLAQTYLPRGEYLADRRGDGLRFKELEKDNDAASAFKRQVAAGFLTALLVALFLTGGVLYNLGR